MWHIVRATRTILIFQTLLAFQILVVKLLNRSHWFIQFLFPLLASCSCCSIHLYFMLPSKPEGYLAMYRSSLVQNKHLAQLAKVITQGINCSTFVNFFVNAIIWGVLNSPEIRIIRLHAVLPRVSTLFEDCCKSWFSCVTFEYLQWMEGYDIIIGLTCVWKKISAMPWLTVLRLYLVSF